LEREKQRWEDAAVIKTSLFIGSFGFLALLAVRVFRWE
jgi:hypothetical protein